MIVYEVVVVESFKNCCLEVEMSFVVCLCDGMEKKSVRGKEGKLEIYTFARLCLASQSASLIHGTRLTVSPREGAS